MASVDIQSLIFTGVIAVLIVLALAVAIVDIRRWR